MNIVVIIVVFVVLTASQILHTWLNNNSEKWLNITLAIGTVIMRSVFGVVAADYGLAFLLWLSVDTQTKTDNVFVMIWAIKTVSFITIISSNCKSSQVVCAR